MKKKLVFLFVLVFSFLVLDAKEYKYTNELIKEDSPYLQQHAHNPVNWYAWKKEAFKKAKKENKLIFLSIGYSTCHWCHVMEKESFANEEVAKILNKNFISIKVDREEKPHIDKYYQDVYKFLNNNTGGWPLNIILTKDLKPFYAATYMPKEDKYSKKGIKKVLQTISNIYIKNENKILQNAESIDFMLKTFKTQDIQRQKPDLLLINKFISKIEKDFDKQYAGIGNKPKFPHASILETLLDIYSVSKNKKALDLAIKTLKAMAKGGIYDQIDGGFYRYSVDEKWMIPHFEKMLYTNAELLSVYTKAYLITKDILFKNIVDELVFFIKNRFEKDALLFSASDADSLNYEGKKEEGFYFVYEYDEVLKALNKKEYSKDKIAEVLEYYNISKEGNFEHNRVNLYIRDKNTPNNLKEIKEIFREIRSKKKYPFMDKKILTSWNAMMINSLFKAGQINKEYEKLAFRYLNTLIKNMYVNNTLYHQKLIGKVAKEKALLEDYSFLISALLEAYKTSFKKEYLRFATKLTKEAITKFYNNKQWYMSEDKFKVVSSFYDDEYKSSTSNMIDNIFKIAILNNDLDLNQFARLCVENISSSLNKSPSSMAWMLRNLIAYERGYILLKSNKEKLENKNILEHEFLLKKEINESIYLACTIDTCFSYSKEYLDVEKEIADKLYKK